MLPRLIPSAFAWRTDAQLVVAVDHRFALGNRPALPSAPAKKSFSSVSSPIFACSVFTSTAGAGSARRVRAKDARRSLQELRAPLRDLVGMHVELLSQLGQRPLALDGGQRHLGLESRAVVPARSSGHRALLALGHHADVARMIHSTPLFRFPEPALRARVAIRRLAVSAATTVVIDSRPMSPPATWLRPASLCTSEATTAKPRPASLARAASIAALSARRPV